MRYFLVTKKVNGLKQLLLIMIPESKQDAVQMNFYLQDKIKDVDYKILEMKGQTVFNKQLKNPVRLEIYNLATIANILLDIDKNIFPNIAAVHQLGQVNIDTKTREVTKLKMYQFENSSHFRSRQVSGPMYFNESEWNEVEFLPDTDGRLTSDFQLLNELNKRYLSSDDFGKAFDENQPGIEEFPKELIKGRLYFAKFAKPGISTTYTTCWKKGQDVTTSDMDVMEMQINSAKELLRNYASSLTAFFPCGKHHTKTIKNVVSAVEQKNIGSFEELIGELKLHLERAKKPINLEGSLVRRIAFMTMMFKDYNHSDALKAARNFATSINDSIRKNPQSELRQFDAAQHFLDLKK